MKKAKKILVLVLSALLLMSLTVVGTLAYLTVATNVVENTFTVGNVSFVANGALDEAEVDDYGENASGRTTANIYKLIPGHQYIKDPTVHMSADTEDAWLFVKVVNGIADIEAGVVDAKPQYEGVVNNNTVSGKIEDQMLALGWVKIEGETGVYAYNTKVSKNQHIAVFAGFALDDQADVVYDATVEGDIDWTKEKITIQAYAVQADGFESDDTTPGYLKAWEEAPLADWQNN